MEQRYAEATDRMRAALRAAADLRSASAAEADDAERELTAREAAVRHVLSLLDEERTVSR